MQTSQTIFRRSAFGAALLCSTVVLAGCQTIGFGTDLGVESGRTITTHAQGGMVDGYGSVEATTLANQALAALAKGDFETASTRINAALRLDITNARLQFLNGLTYHMMALEGDSTKLDMAEQGYTLALKFDPGNVLVKRHLARLYMEQERFAQAEGLLAGVAVYHHDDPDVLYDLAVAAYYNHDPETAEAALSHLAEVAPERAHTPAILRARAMVMAALDDTAAAEKALDGCAGSPPIRPRSTISNGGFAIGPISTRSTPTRSWPSTIPTAPTRPAAIRSRTRPHRRGMRARRPAATLPTARWWWSMWC